MEEENDDQWLYGEDPPTDKPSETENAVEKTPSTDIFSEKAHDSFMNPTEDGDDNATDLEPPIIKPLDANTFDNDAPPPGEEELLVPPFIPAPDSTNEKDQNADEDQAAVNGDANGVEGDEENTDRKLSEGEQEDDDDNINVVIGDIRTAPNYSAPMHIKRGNLLTLTKVQQQKPQYYQQQQFQPGAGGKFAVDDFESVGVINGVPAHEFNLDNLEEKPWRKPGADITDYFNYGFNEDTWRAYCERQKRIRVHESGSGLIPMNTSSNVNVIPNVSVPPPNMMMPPVGVPPPDMNSGNINVISNANNRRNTDVFSKENTIQVMTADRREYSKKNFTPDLSVPPPTVVPPPFGAIPPGMPPPPFPPMNQYGPPPGDYFTPEMDPYYQSYEPAQEPNWGGPSTNWNSNVEIPISNGNPMGGNPDLKPSISDNGPPGVKIKIEPEDRDISRDRDRDRTRDYDRERDRHRDRSHRHRSRSRSHERRARKHKSRSRSPGYRSHKKKKSKKTERSKSDSD